MSVSVKELSFRYPRSPEPVLRNIGFEAPNGNVTAVIGANGAGKSTLIKCVLGILRGSGSVRFDGAERAELGSSALHRMVGYMTQEGALLSSLSVLDVVLLGRLESLHLRVPEEDIEKAMSILRLLHLEHLAERPFYALSGGQRRMVDVAQVLVRDPQVLIMDEPTANLDLVNELQVLELTRAYTHQRGTATILTLHDLNMAARFADRLVLLREGAVYRAGTPEEVITEEAIREAYGVRVRVSLDENRVPMLHTLSPLSETEYHF